jgi:hypothetical protein
MNAPTDSPSTSRPSLPPLVLPVTGQALREALLHNDTAALTRLVLQLRIAGYRVDPARLAGQLLEHGCIWVEDAFGHPVPLHMRVPPAEPQLLPDESLGFHLAA